jgi:hypothetical protein
LSHGLSASRRYSAKENADRRLIDCATRIDIMVVFEPTQVSVDLFVIISRNNYWIIDMQPVNVGLDKPAIAFL